VDDSTAAAPGSLPRGATSDSDVATEAGRNAAFDGVRFVAVGLVLAAHFGIPGFRAGFLGVDVFFVLSGFLITGILLGQVERGRVRLDHFWMRRVRRLAPALVLVLGTMIVWGAEFAPTTARDDLRGDIKATLLYVANWHFIRNAGYFHSTGHPSALLHMWSLAVEEQFYVFWPVTLFLVAFLVRKKRARLPIVGCLAVVGIAISAWRLSALWHVVSVDRAYMGTDSRMFEPLVGAALAVLLMWRPRIGSSRAVNGALVGVGVGLLVAGMFTLSNAEGPSLLYPHGGALLFSVGSAALIWAVATPASLASAVLALPPVAYLGRISYGIYIWHWPLIIWATTDQMGLGGIGGMSRLERVPILTALTIGISVLSYHLVEKPIRYGAAGRQLRGLRILVALPVALGVLLALDLSAVVAHAGAKIEVIGPRGKATGTSVTKTIVLVGDSVPEYFAPELADAAAPYGYVVVKATAGGCPATAAPKAHGDGKPFRNNWCPQVAVTQDNKVAYYRPALIIWWSRYEITPRLGPNGKLLPLGGPAYEKLQRRAFAKRVASLTKLGARVVAIQIEHPGIKLAIANPPERHLLYGQIMLHDWFVVDEWNAFLASHHGPKVFSISINSLVCHKPLRENTCDDTLPDGNSARFDGTHYASDAGPVIAPVIIRRSLKVAGLLTPAPATRKN